MCNPFDSTTLDTGNELIRKMAAENKRRWEEIITLTDLTCNSWKTNDPTASKPPCLVTANQVAHQLIVNGRGEMPTKPKCPQVSPISEDNSSLEFAFIEEEYKKGIATLKNKKAAGIDDVLVEQLNNCITTTHKYIIIYISRFFYIIIWIIVKQFVEDNTISVWNTVIPRLPHKHLLLPNNLLFKILIILTD